MKKISILFFVIIVFFSCKKDDIPLVCDTDNFKTEDKINGGSILQTWKLSYSLATHTEEDIINSTDLVQKTNSNWVSLSPIVYISFWGHFDDPTLPYWFEVNSEVYKMRTIIPKMINSGLQNIMLKPLTSFWGVNGSYFWGDFYVDTEEEWKGMEMAYRELFYEFAKLSEDFPQIKMLSIGNELREFATRRPQFFKALISEIRRDFPSLKLTYSANWDEYQSINFWEDLDYIGVNSYFPLINKKTPTVDEIKKALIPIKEDLQAISCTFNKPILFTEYGYRSTDYAIWKSWLLKDIPNKNINFEVQKNGYNAFYDTFWNEPWVAGGFFWEWRVILDRETTNPNNTGWYVNSKPVEKIIRDRYTD